MRFKVASYLRAKKIYLGNNYIQVKYNQKYSVSLLHPVKTFNGLNLLFKKKICQK